MIYYSQFWSNSGQSLVYNSSVSTSFSFSGFYSIELFSVSSSSSSSNFMSISFSSFLLLCWVFLSFLNSFKILYPLALLNRTSKWPKGSWSCSLINYLALDLFSTKNVSKSITEPRIS